MVHITALSPEHIVFLVLQCWIVSFTTKRITWITNVKMLVYLHYAQTKWYVGLLCIIVKGSNKQINVDNSCPDSLVNRILNRNRNGVPWNFLSEKELLAVNHYPSSLEVVDFHKKFLNLYFPFLLEVSYGYQQFLCNAKYLDFKTYQMQTACQVLILRYKMDGRETESKNSFIPQKKICPCRDIFKTNLVQFNHPQRTCV